MHKRCQKLEKHVARVHICSALCITQAIPKYIPNDRNNSVIPQPHITWKDTHQGALRGN